MPDCNVDLRSWADVTDEYGASARMPVQFHLDGAVGACRAGPRVEVRVVSGDGRELAGVPPMAISAGDIEPCLSELRRVLICYGERRADELLRGIRQRLARLLERTDLDG